MAGRWSRERRDRERVFASSRVAPGVAATGVNGMKTALVCGAGGFIGSHLVKELKRQGYWVRGVDLK